ncbi:MAG: hypothetical protein BWY32_01863 [bacterium ADurb.Bin243]|nr:MAG: hypothetical protein BWY32_01863 [bacterium ADurb.Bin243]
MSSLKADFDELLERIKHGRDFRQASFEPIYYLVFSTSKIIDVKRHMNAWTSKLNNAGWTVNTFSIYENIQDILSNSPLRKIWLSADGKAPTDWNKTNQSLAEAVSKGQLLARLDKKLDEIKDQTNPILLVTDLEALHPYLRIGAIESQLQGKFVAPTIFFYPGERTGKTKLKFLGFYPDDGNYRSVHVGG